jgi:hypothetical protein
MRVGVCDCGSLRHTSAYVSIRQHTVGIREEAGARRRVRLWEPAACVSIRQHTSAFVSILSAYVRRRVRRRVQLWEPAAYVSIRQHTSAYVSIRQHTYREGGRAGGGGAEMLYDVSRLVAHCSPQPAPGRRQRSARDTASASARALAAAVFVFFCGRPKAGDCGGRKRALLPLVWPRKRAFSQGVRHCRHNEFDARRRRACH